MLAYERLAVAFFIVFAVTALGRGTAGDRGAWRGLGAAVGAALLVAGTAQAGSEGLRAWMGHAWLALGYWVPALLATGMPGRFEAWLVRGDARWRRQLGVPRWAETIGDVAYLACYPLVPASFLVVWMAGDAADVARYWAAVLAAGFVCYGSLPWLISRPPRLLREAALPRGRLAGINALVLARVSHQLNTFPSGHVAVSVAAALAVVPVSGTAGALCGALAVGVAAGAVTGRYHYVADVVLGGAAGIAVAAAVLAWL